MLSKNDMRIVIVGGSVAGLTLANILEQIGIDYILLEKYASIAPDLGASIATFPNGGRILDQIGCYDKIAELIEDGSSNQHMCMRSPDGKKFLEILNLNDILTSRFGYKAIFLERQQLLQILYDNIKDKSKILVEKNVVHLEQTSGSVKAITKDGISYTGDILVGADGVHSAIRQQMWRLADQQDPAYFPAHDRKGVRVPYRCIFGVSTLLPGLDLKYSNNILGAGHSFLVAGGPHKLVYWFLFVQNQESHNTLHETIPRYTEKEMEDIAERFRNTPVTETIAFGALWDSRTTATLTALPEFVHSKWHFGRVVTIGDAAHKFNPINGQGGNNAIEDCAVLVNQLTTFLAAGRSEKTRLSDGEVEQLFTQFEKIRLGRVQSFMERGHSMQKLQAQDDLRGSLSAFLFRRLASAEFAVNGLSRVWLAAPRVDALLLPDRSHSIPFGDELVRQKPITVYSGLLVSIALASVLLLGNWAFKSIS